LGAIAIGKLTKFSSVSLMFYALIMCTASLFGIGPSFLLGFGPSAVSTFIGVSGVGLFTAAADVLTIPILIKSIEDEEGDNIT
jgi:hypothetical protein